MSIIETMSEGVKRRYNARKRRQAAEETRRRILDAARRLFVEQGYVATTMNGIAADAGVALDTIYASVGPKPALLRLLIETAISGEDVPVSALERGYVRAMQAERNPARKLELYARALRHIQPRLAPIFRVVQPAALVEPEIGDIWREISERRGRNMRLLAAELIESGHVREELSLDDVADIVWSMNSSEFYALLVFECGWSPDHYEEWLASAWKRLLLRN